MYTLPRLLHIHSSFVLLYYLWDVHKIYIFLFFILFLSHFFFMVIWLMKMIFLTIRLFAMHHKYILLFLIIATFAVCGHMRAEYVREGEHKQATILYGTHSVCVPTNCDKQDTQSVDIFCIFFFVIVAAVVVLVAVVIFRNSTKN